MLTSDELNAKLPYAFGNELAWLKSIANEIQTCVVLGAGPGIMSIALLEVNPHMILVAIDNNPTVLSTFDEHMAAAGIVDYIVWNNDTVQAAQEWEDDRIFQAACGDIDLLIVDADHSARAVENDLKAWLPFVRTGGYIFFHDYIDTEQTGTNGVAKVVDALDASRFLLVDNPGVSAVVKKL